VYIYIYIFTHRYKQIVASELLRSLKVHTYRLRSIKVELENKTIIGPSLSNDMTAVRLSTRTRASSAQGVSSEALYNLPFTTSSFAWTDTDQNVPFCRNSPSKTKKRVFFYFSFCRNSILSITPSIFNKKKPPFSVQDTRDSTYTVHPQKTRKPNGRDCSMCRTGLGPFNLVQLKS